MDKLSLDNYLLILKSTVEVYVHGTLEASNEDIKSTLLECLNDTIDSQKNTYNNMIKYDWYTVNNVDSQTITKTLNQVLTKN